MVCVAALACGPSVVEGSATADVDTSDSNATDDEGSSPTGGGTDADGSSGRSDSDDTTTSQEEPPRFHAYLGQTVNELYLILTKEVPSEEYCVRLTLYSGFAHENPPKTLEAVATPPEWVLDRAVVFGPTGDCWIDYQDPSQMQVWSDASLGVGEIGWEGTLGCTVDVDVALEFSPDEHWEADVDFLAAGLEVERSEDLMPCAE